MITARGGLGLIVALLFAAITILACGSRPGSETPVAGGPSPPPSEDGCGVGICDGQENTQNCPQDCLLTVDQFAQMVAGGELRTFLSLSEGCRALVCTGAYPGLGGRGLPGVGVDLTGCRGARAVPVGG